MTPLYLFIAAALLILLGAALWALDSRKKRSAGAEPARDEEEQRASQRPSQGSEQENSEQQGTDQQSSAQPQPEGPNRAAGRATGSPSDAGDGRGAPSGPEEDAVSAQDPAESREAGAQEPLDVEVEGDEEPNSGETRQNPVLQERLEAPTVAAGAERDRRTRGFSVPGSARRERKAWSQEHGFSFERSDSYLNDEWSRGAAAGGEDIRDVVSGVVNEREFYLMDMGAIPVMAVRRVGHTDVVVDFRRRTVPSEASEELLPCGSVEGFEMYSDQQGAAARFVDERVCAALEAMPAAVDAVWLEGDWVLAQLDKASHADDWDNVLAPLTLIADAAPVLPPRAGADRPLEADTVIPSRLMAAPPKTQEPDAAPTLKQGEEAEPPIVVRPDEPLEMPQRAEPTARGVVQPRAVGGDEVDAIGEDAGPPVPDDRHGTRMVRKLAGSSSIFDDLAEELGGDPLEEDAPEEPEGEAPSGNPEAARPEEDVPEEPSSRDPRS